MISMGMPLGHKIFSRKVKYSNQSKKKKKPPSSYHYHHHHIDSITTMGRKFNRNRGRANTTNWENATKENENWQNYYQTLNLPAAEEWDTFKKACQTPLPLTFRVTGSSKVAHEVRTAINEKYIPLTTGVSIDGGETVVEPPAPLEFYPDNMAYKFNVAKSVIRRNKEFAKLQRFLVVETDAGHISRQEAVSMVPPLFMDIKSDHAVLDMCAAPGSKTAQLVEALHKDEAEGAAPPTGFVIANDSDYKRSHLLVHQVKRLSSPNIVVTNHDAQFYPRIKVSENEYLKFDRILCDVPCSGDGTMRKNVNVWKDWKVSNGLGLHTLQLNILLRGLQLLKPGGRLVYSTCSLNPIENESVVAEALRQLDGSVELVDVSDQLPNLKRSPGINAWKVANKAGEWVEQPDGPKLPASLFPPTEAEIEKFNLDRTLRVYPHQQDTGGFYIAVLKKKAQDETAGSKRTREAEDDDEASKKAKVDDETAAVVPAKKEKVPRDANEEPFIFLPADHPVIEKCWNFYGINDQFPKDSLLVRNSTGEPTRVIYYVSPTLRPVIQLNESKLKLIHTGIKMFSFQRNTGENTCEWRIQIESITLLANATSSKRRAEASLDLLKTMVTEAFPTFPQLRERYPEFYAQVENMAEGCIIVNIPAPTGGVYTFPVWKGKGSCNLMLPKEDLHEVRLRVFQIDEEKAGSNVNNNNNNSAKKPEEQVSTENKEDESAEKKEEESAEQKEDASEENKETPVEKEASTEENL